MMSLTVRPLLLHFEMIPSTQYMTADAPPSRLYATLQPSSSISWLSRSSVMPSVMPFSRPSTITKQ